MSYTGLGVGLSHVPIAFRNAFWFCGRLCLESRSPEHKRYNSIDTGLGGFGRYRLYNNDGFYDALGLVLVDIKLNML